MALDGCCAAHNLRGVLALVLLRTGAGSFVAWLLVVSAMQAANTDFRWIAA